MLSRHQFLRYGPTLCIDSVGEPGQLALQQARVTIVGLGGLGCPVSQYLVAAGIGQLTLVDSDRVQWSNLQRQTLYRETDINCLKVECAARQLRALNSEVNITPLAQYADSHTLPELVAACDLVVDCTDNLATRRAINKICYRHGRRLISGAAAELAGQLLALDPALTHGCYCCLYPDSVPDAAPCDRIGVLGPLVGVVGAMQALLVVQALTGQAVPWGKLQTFSANSHSWAHHTIPKASDCSYCGMSYGN